MNKQYMHICAMRARKNRFIAIGVLNNTENTLRTFLYSVCVVSFAIHGLWSIGCGFFFLTLMNMYLCPIEVVFG